MITVYNNWLHCNLYSIGGRRNSSFSPAWRTQQSFTERLVEQQTTRSGDRKPWLWRHAHIWQQLKYSTRFYLLSTLITCWWYSIIISIMLIVRFFLKARQIHSDKTTATNNPLITEPRTRTTVYKNNIRYLLKFNN